MNGHRRGDVARRVGAASIAVLAVSLGLVCGASAAAGSGGQGALVAADASDDMRGRWGWPVSPPLITVAYRAPAHAYGPGHRGIDLSSDVGADVRAPDDGIVAFAGVVVDRPLITIDHGDGLVSTMEPVHAGVPVGARVQRGEWVGTVGLGGHTTPVTCIWEPAATTSISIRSGCWAGCRERCCCRAARSVRTRDRCCRFR